MAPIAGEPAYHETEALKAVQEGVRELMNPEPGRRFGPYEVLGRLGVGGMGYVYRAWDVRLQREVALKLLHNEFAMPGMRERFLREARAASALNHPNICTIFDIGEQNGEPYLVMELLEGITLRERIAQGALPPRDLICIAREIAEALGAAHARGIVHRDVKPANIFLVQKPNGVLQAKILDFGLAKMPDEDAGRRAQRSLHLTNAGATVGTLAYMSPEQARGEVLDARSDLFSLGVVMYEMATQQVPFAGATSALVSLKLLNEPPQPLRAWNAALPRELDKIVQKLLAKERSGRFQSAHDLELALQQLEAVLSRRFHAFSRKDEQGSSGWLQRAMASLSLGRITDLHEHSSVGSGTPAPQPIAEADALRAQTRASESPESRVLRPVARLPRGDTPPPCDAKMVALSAQAASETKPEMAPKELPQAIQTPESAAHRQGNSPTGAARTALNEGRTAPTAPPPPIPPARVAACTEHKRGTAGEPSGEASPRGPRSVTRLPVSLRLVTQIAVIALVFSIVVALALQNGPLHPALLSDQDSVVLTEIANETGDPAFDGTLSALLAMTLRQSPYLRLLSDNGYRNARKLVRTAAQSSSPGARADDLREEQSLARETARRLQTKAYLFGSIAKEAGKYRIQLSLIDTGTGKVMSTFAASAGDAGDLPAALDRLAHALRAEAGEDRASITHNDLPLARVATSNLAALTAFVHGEDLLAGASSANGSEALAALPYLRRAVAADAHFVQAQLRLAELYRRLHAEVAAAAAANAAQSASNPAEPIRTEAEYAFAMNVSGDYGTAAATLRHLLMLYPHDGHALRELAEALRLEGRPSEALQAARTAIGEDPLDGDAYTEAVYALVDLNRFDEAGHLAAQAQSLGIGNGEASLLANLLAETTGRAARSARPPASFVSTLALDESGRLDEGAKLWQAASDDAAEHPGLISAGAFDLAQAALDRALLADCSSALTFARRAAALPAGLMATFHRGLAEALCGDSAGATAALADLQRSYPSSFVVAAFAEADLQAALALDQNQPQTALEALAATNRFDAISPSAYLRAQADAALNQPQAAIAEYQGVIAHRGSNLSEGLPVYPAAELGLARAYAECGNLPAAEAASRRLMELWAGADPRQPPLREVQAHLH
jgi:serine/threonine-protein kinase